MAKNNDLGPELDMTADKYNSSSQEAKVRELPKIQDQYRLQSRFKGSLSHTSRSFLNKIKQTNKKQARQSGLHL